MDMIDYPANIVSGSEKIDSPNDDITVLVRSIDGYQLTGLKVNGTSVKSGLVKPGSGLNKEWTISSGSIDSSKLLDILFIIPFSGSIIRN